MDNVLSARSIDGIRVKQTLPPRSHDAIKHGKNAAQPRRGVKASRRHLQNSKTLMRIGLKKPAISSKAIRRVQTPAGTTPPHASQLVKLGTNKGNHALKKVQQTEKNRLVTHFGSATSSKVVAFTKRAVPTSSSKQIPDRSSKTTISDKQSPLQLLLDNGLKQAQSHTARLSNQSKSSTQHFYRNAIIVVLVILISGYIGFLKVPSLDVSLAGARAGIHAVMPSYQPAGFAFQAPVHYSRGIVTIDFKSTTDQRTFSISQQATLWSAQNLQAEFLPTIHKTYQTFYANNQPIFIFLDGTATWINQGVWYTLAGSADLSTSQIISIAQST